MLKQENDHWSPTEADEAYEVSRWSNGYFSVGAGGNVLVHPRRSREVAVDLMDMIQRLRLRGVDMPVLVRFNDILKDRIDQIREAFQRAIAEHDYQSDYCCVYPVKVNQQRQVVEQILEHGREHAIGLEVGSKPELLAMIALVDDDRPIICNGFKDASFIEMALMSQKIGRRVIPVVEKTNELDLIIELAGIIGVRPRIGMRVKLSARGSGRWQSSGGHQSKFGLTVTEILQSVERLESLGMADCFQLLHFHLGSQITNIRHIKAALIEAARVYADLVRRGAGLKYLDVGGGLGVDYDGSQTNFESSVNYTLQEYANDVIYHVQTVCEDAGVPHPAIMSESGRAIAAYHSVLVTEVLDVASPTESPIPDQLPEHFEQPLFDLFDTYKDITVRNLLERFHDAQQALDMVNSAFATGHLPLDQRSIAETLYWSICRTIRQLANQLEYVPEELEKLDHLLAETYFCNFSVFQSLPDSWAIKQLFPVMPIHRLGEAPTRLAVLGDITCDSDGKLSHFIDRRGVSRTLRVHSPNRQSYYLGVFLVGAYQEILGDLHNLFGDTNAVHVTLDGDDVLLDSMIKGDTVSEVLRYVQYNDEELLVKLQRSVEIAVRKELIDHRVAGRFLSVYEAGLRDYTYLNKGERDGFVGHDDSR